jgi:hypothetical protein
MRRVCDDFTCESADRRDGAGLLILCVQALEVEDEM